MEPMEKLEIIVEGTLMSKKRDRDISKDKTSNLYVLGLDHEINTLSWVLYQIDAIKRKHPSMSDEMVLKMYQPDRSK
jgi:hypothetical protein